MHKLFTLALLLLSFSIHAQWYNQVSGVSENLYGVAFANKDTGVVVGGSLNNSVFLRTLDGGMHWSPTYFNDTKWMYDVVYLGDGAFIACGNNGVMYKSTDYGQSWLPRPSGTNEWLYNLFFLNPDTGYCVGQNGLILRSVNGGNNWSALSYQAPSTLLSICFLDELHGITCGMGGRMFRTTDGGNQWEEVNNEENKTLKSISMLTPDTVMVCGINGMIEFSSDSGLNWVTQISTTPYNLNDMVFSDKHTGYIAGDGVLLKTTDGGQTWFQMNYPVTTELFGIDVIDFGTAYAVGESGTIIKNDLTIQVEEESMISYLIYPNPTSDRILIQLDETFEPYTLFIYNQQGQIVFSDNPTQSPYTLSIAGWPLGMYYGRINRGGQTIAFRFVAK